MDDQLLPPGPPLVTRVDTEAPLDVSVGSPRTKPPRPGLFEAALLTGGFAVVVFGTMIVLVLVAAAAMILTDPNGLDPVKGAKPGSVGSLPPGLANALAISFPVAYAAGFAYAVLVLHIVVGRTWVWELGLHRLPPYHLGLAILALPAFVILSDVLARLLFHAFRMEHLMEQSGDLGELFRSFHWSFAVLAVGVGPGVVEELWCRGFLGRGFVGRYGWAIGVFLTSLAFGLLHLYPPPYVLVTACMGAALHFTYIASRSLWVPIAIHLLNNSFAALVAVNAIPTERIDAAMMDRPLAIVAAALVLLLASGLAMWSGRARVEPATGVAHRGVMAPPPESEPIVVDRRPNALAALAAVVCFAGMMLVLFA